MDEKRAAVFFLKIIPKLSVGIDPVNDFSLSFDWHELKKQSDEILDLPEMLAKNKACKFIICLDEFQNLATFKGFHILEKKMRASWQRQGSVTYCICGSKCHMMSEIFNKPSNPFYRFGDIISLPKIERDEWVRFIKSGFRKTGKTVDGRLAEKIPELMKNHSWYVQQLAHYTWNLTEKEAGINQIHKALQELINANSPLYQKEIEGISPTQLNLLKAISKGEKQLTGAGVMQKYLLGTPNNVLKNKNILVNADLIHQDDNKYEFLDPAFDLWFRKEFFGIPINSIV